MPKSAAAPYRSRLLLAFAKAFLVYSALQCLMESDAVMRGMRDGWNHDHSALSRLPEGRP